MALFGMLLKEKYDFEVAFVNYKTRENSDYEQKLVEEYANEHGIKCHVLEKKCSSAAISAKNINLSPLEKSIPTTP